MDSLPADPPEKPKNTGVGSLSLLQGIFLTQESNRGLPRILHHLSYQGSPWTVLCCVKTPRQLLNSAGEMCFVLTVTNYWLTSCLECLRQTVLSCRFAKNHTQPHRHLFNHISVIYYGGHQFCTHVVKMEAVTAGCSFGDPCWIITGTECSWTPHFFFFFCDTCCKNPRSRWRVGFCLIFRTI